ncbi:metal ABC transporter solute-binding protein, Zn/Mn family [Hydrogenophaga sp. BPS33]|uniref:metal ABC transporter solute-binding protein, Zn/Mn family n=1 Tax=Hydrogenophaga sp. BPS33 TaxID=2651974 RepID=UPI00131FF33F|nr:zinc ABC transporter substrate-binding protein [Hydrogenophaga sp. BPS33]QHE86712.1 metal ABC transporter substrate-binding protein [Hydrogenophaga sp. BPS33]
MTSRRSLGPWLGPWFRTGLLALSLGATSVAFAQPAAKPAASAAMPARLLVSHPVVAALTTVLVHDTGIGVLRPAPETLPPNRQLAFFSGRGANALGEAARQADAVVALRSIWPDDPLFPLARRENIRLIEIDAARPLDASLPGMALQEQAASANDLPWLDPVNLGRMADVIVGDVARLVPVAKARLQANAAALRRQVLDITAQSEARLATASNVAVFSLSDRLHYLVNGFNLDLAGTDARADEAWTPQALADLTKQLRSASVAAVLHHRELPAPVAQAVQQAGVKTIVLQTEGRDPIAELRENSERLSAIAQR